MSALQQFENQQYICIETFRKNGQAVKTPTWFVLESGTLLVWTEATSGKVKRIRNNGKTNIVPSRGDGAPVGEWVSTIVEMDDSIEVLKNTRQKLKRKYGFVFNMFELLGRMRRAQYTSLKIRVAG